MSLTEELKQIQTIFNLELNECVEVEGETLSHFRTMIGLSELKGKVYFNSSNLILTHIYDYNRVKDLFTHWEDTIKVECPKFQAFYYIGSYLNCPELKKLFWVK